MTVRPLAVLRATKLQTTLMRILKLMMIYVPLVTTLSVPSVQVVETCVPNARLLLIWEAGTAP